MIAIGKQICAFSQILAQRLNDLNQKLQGKDELISELFEKITLFQRQLQLFAAELNVPNLVHISTCRKLSEQVAGACKGTTGDARCVTEILGGGQK